MLLKSFSPDLQVPWIFFLNVPVGIIGRASRSVHQFMEERHMTDLLEHIDTEVFDILPLWDTHTMGGPDSSRRDTNMRATIPSASCPGQDPASPATFHTAPPCYMRHATSVHTARSAQVA